MTGRACRSGHAALSFFNSRRQSARKSRTVNLSLVSQYAKSLRDCAEAGWPGTGKPPAWSLTTRPARPPNAGPSPSICEGWNGGTAPTAKPQQNHVTQELTPRAHHGHTTVSGESNSGGRTRRTGHAKGHQNNITQELTPSTITPSPSCPIRMKVAPCDEDMTLRDAVQHSHLIIQDG